MKKTKKKHK